MATELEIKLRVPDEESLARLERELGDRLRAIVHQRNIFFDTAARALLRAGWVCRLRCENGRATLTLKGRSQWLGAAVSRPELECELATDLAHSVCATPFVAGSELAAAELLPAAGMPAADELRALLRRHASEEPLLVLGQFTNDRRSYGLLVEEHELTLETDRTRLPGGQVDFEVEVEIEPDIYEAVLRDLRTLFAAQGIEWQPAESKFVRFARAAGCPWLLTPGG